MSRHKSAEDVERELLDAMGSTLGPLFHALYNEVTWLHAKWLEYRKLYAHSPRRITLLNDSAGFFFRVAQDVMWENVLLHIARLTDPPKQGQFENLTLRRLPDALDRKKEIAEIRRLVENAVECSAFAREWRNRRLAHSELSLAVDSKAKPLPGVSRQQIENALAAFRRILNHLHRRYLDGEVGFEHFISGPGDADALIFHLRAAAHYQEQKMKRLRDGKSLPEDFNLPPKE